MKNEFVYKVSIMDEKRFLPPDATSFEGQIRSVHQQIAAGKIGLLRRSVLIVLDAGPQMFLGSGGVFCANSIDQ